MFLRKTLATFVIFLILLVSVPIFLVYGMGKTYFDENFYQGQVSRTSYDFLINVTSEKMYKDSTLLEANFTLDEVKASLKTSFTEQMFSEVLNDFAKQVLAIQSGGNEKLVLNLEFFRDTLLSVVNNLAYKIYQKLPTCTDSQIAGIKFGTEVPTCVPPKVDYDIVVNPFIQNFQAEVYKNVPDKLSDLEKVVPVKLLQNFSSLRNTLFASLLILLGLLAFLMWKPFSRLIRWEGAAFIGSGLVGLIISFLRLSYFNVVTPNETILSFYENLVVLLMDEVRKLSFIFLIIGFALVVISAVIKRTMENEKPGFR